MKIDEPKTPFEAYESDGEDGKEELDANLLAARISAEGHKGPRPRRYVWSSFVDDLLCQGYLSQVATLRTYLCSLPRKGRREGALRAKERNIITSFKLSRWQGLSWMRTTRRFSDSFISLSPLLLQHRSSCHFCILRSA